MTLAVVQATAKNTLSSTITATGSGHGLVVCVSSFQSSGTPSVSGVTLGGVSLTQAVNKIFSSSGLYGTWIYYLPNAASGQTAVVVSGTNLTVASGDGGVDIYEVASMATSSPLDKAPAGGSGSGASFASASTGTLSQAGEIAFGVCDCISPSNPSGFTNLANAGKVSGYQIVSATTALTYGASQGGGPYSAIIATFKAASVANTQGLLPMLSLMP